MFGRVILKYLKIKSKKAENYKLLFSESRSIDLGISYLNQKNYELATKEFNKVLEVNPENETAHAKLGHVYLQQKNFPQAIAQFKQALKLNPRSIESLFGLGFYCFERGDIEEAINKFDYVLKLEPNNEHAHFGLGLSYRQKKEFDKAIEEFNYALKINPRHPQVNYELCLCYHALGLFYQQQKEFSRAIAQFKQILKLNPQDWRAHESLASVYLEQDRLALCLEELQQIKDLGLHSDTSYRIMSQIYIKQKKYDLAVEELQKTFNYSFVNKGASKYFIKDDIVSRQDSNGIKILRIPNFYGSEILSTEMNSIMLPPLALGNIVSYIRSQGIRIDQDDLHIKIHYDNCFSKDPEEKINEAVFFDDRRVVEYTNGNGDPEIDRIMEIASNKTSFKGYKIILFSLDSCSKNFSHVMFALSLAKYLKKKYNPVIILGGLTYFLEIMQKIGCTWPDIDYVICKEGEEILANLLFFLLGSPLLEKKTVTETTQKVLYADRVPPPVKPDFDGLPLDRYKYRGLKTDYCQDEKLRGVINELNASGVFLLPFRFIKGCTNNCIFCASSYGGLIHVVDPKTVVSWLQDLQTKYNPTGYLFLNDTLNISKKYLNQLCDEIIERKLNILWSDCVRVDRLDKDSIYKMRDAGCIRMVFGMETASKKLLNYINKKIDLKHLEDMLYWADKAGIWTGIEIISGLPYEEEKDVDKTLSFLKQNKEYIDAVYYNAFNIKDTSLIQICPERYGITNIFELLNYEDGFSTFVKYGFDEIRGLKWPEKRKQIISHFNKIIENFGEVPFPEHEYEHFLFFLYSKYSDKKTIKTLFYSVGDEKIQYVKALCKAKSPAQYPKGAAEKMLTYGGK